jgi:UDP-N-acetyl-2-amino-2-deoxyglucuronate dehydrogenase
MERFALIGAAGFIAPRHMKAIKDTGNSLVAAVDPSDSVGVIDSYFPEARFFTEIERFDRHLEKLRRKDEGGRVGYISICSPNYLHDAHIRLALRLNTHAVCEKPLVINPWNLDALEELEAEYETNVYTVLQLRLIPRLQALKEQLGDQAHRRKVKVDLAYITRRGNWYDVSWKGDQSKSGGVVMNIGIHFFDLLIWLFGQVESLKVDELGHRRARGTLELEWARVNWFLSVDEQDLPDETRSRGEYAHRSLKLEGDELDLSKDFADLHTRVYREIFAGSGFGISDAREAIQLVYDIRHQ